ncbi:Glycosyltransferase involved in cell wall bisynthesis [Nonlabens sp. Hel1_33_55]|uniref:glycosyltransferase n=1 Tax=Nonlabens sp. Hel1_33_55 TaxID=1336802 RepID=UPI000875E5D8|nr:glycosyltransferase [Nonlabens sp. Hel1_33_55]SCX94451.1 Glycosyltransferase involved in cell wall bisynthesis [Nonlabens sp. Hel1_33_55]
MKYIFFTMNSFAHEGGGTIRMTGIMNELAKRCNEVLFISNVTKEITLHESIEQIHIDLLFSATDKRIFQGLVAVSDTMLANLHYRKLLKRLKEIYASLSIENAHLIFCEYLDNSIGYWLKKNGVIPHYTNDLHGVATLELKFQADQAKGFAEKLKFSTKYTFSQLLDKKVFNAANRLIFASSAMKDFFENLYPAVADKDNYILPYLLSTSSFNDEVDEGMRNQILQQYNITPEKKVILFAGAFKKTGGVADLIRAFNKLESDHENALLLLIGDGYAMKDCQDLVEKNNLNDRVKFIGRTKYKELRTYQNISDILVCPDKQNVYSQLIIHVKYLDALLAQKIVINGKFKSVQEVNIDEKLSLNFEPSNIEDLKNTLERALKNTEALKQKYMGSRAYALNNLTYESKIAELEKYSNP